LIEGKLKMSLI